MATHTSQPRTPSDGSDWAALIAASQAGDDVAFGEICDRLREYLLLTADRRLGDDLYAKFGASDIVQQALIEARAGLPSFRGTTEYELRAWLVRLVQHNLVDAARRYREAQKRDISREMPIANGDLAPEPPAPERTASSIVRRRESDEELLRAVAQLPARRQRMIELRHWRGLGFAEIGEEFGISDVAARNLWARTIDELRKKLSGHHADQPTRPR